MDAPPIGSAERGRGDAAGEHPEGEKAAKVDAVGNVAGEVHADRIERKEGEIELAETVGAAGAVEGRPSSAARAGGGRLWSEDALDDTGGLAGGVEGGVGGEGEEEDGDLVEEEGMAPRGGSVARRVHGGT